MKAAKFYLLILVLSALPLVSIFLTSNFPHTHDGVVHLARMAAYFKDLQDGQFPVRWAGDLNYGYGLPLFNFIYQLPYFLSSIFLFLGLGLVLSFKIVLTLSFLLSGVFMLLFAREFFGDFKKAILVTIFYQFAPFRLVEMLVRGSFGEIYTYTFFPLVLFGLTRLFKKQNPPGFLLTGFATALLILSHNSLSLVFFGVSVLFLFVFGKGKRQLFWGAGALFLGLGLAAFYWLPALIEHRYTYGDLFMKDLYLLYFPSFKNFFTPNFTNNVNLQTTGVSVQFGLFHTLAIFLSLFLIWQKKVDPKTKRIFLFCLFLTGLSLFLMQPASEFIWAKIALLRQFQFPWRFLAVVSFASSLLSMGFLSFAFFKKRITFILLLVFVISSTVFYWRPSLGWDKINEEYYWNFPLNTTYFGETDVIWSAGPAKDYPKERVEIIEGSGEIKDFKKKSNLQEFTLVAQTPVKIVSHTQYFPGWRVYLNGKSVPIQFQDINWRGLITFSAPQGLTQIKVIFGESKIRLFSDFISLSSVAFLLIIPLLRKRKII